MDVVHKLIISHLHLANSHCQTQDLLHLEFDDGLNFIHFGYCVLIMSQQGRELVSLIQASAQDLWDLLDQRLKAKMHRNS